MRNFLRFASGPLFDERDPEERGTGTTVLDPGAPLEHDDSPDDDEEQPAGDDDPRTLKQRIADLEAENRRNKEDAAFWANRARTAPQPAPVVEDDTDDGGEPDTPAAAPKKLTGEQIINLLAEEGEDGLFRILKERGDIVTRTEANNMVKQARQETRQMIDQTQSDTAFERQLQQEFPELVAESARVARGLAPKDPFYLRVGEIYREIVTDDPALTGTNTALKMAARQAKAEKGTRSTSGDRGRGEERQPSRGAQRRERIERTQPVRSADRGDEHEEEGNVTDAQREVARRLGVPDKDLQKQLKGGGARRR